MSQAQSIVSQWSEDGLSDIPEYRQLVDEQPMLRKVANLCEDSATFRQGLLEIVESHCGDAVGEALLRLEDQRSGKHSDPVRYTHQQQRYLQEIAALERELERARQRTEDTRFRLQLQRDAVKLGVDDTLEERNKLQAQIDHCVSEQAEHLRQVAANLELNLNPLSHDEASALNKWICYKYNTPGVYVFECQDGAIYTGSASDIGGRLAAHRKQASGSQFVHAHGGFKRLLKVIHCPTRESAFRLEEVVSSELFARYSAERTVYTVSSYAAEERLRQRSNNQHDTR